MVKFSSSKFDENTFKKMKEAIHKQSKVWVAGSQGMVGRAICQRLLREGYQQIISLTKDQLDLRDQKAVNDFFVEQQPNVVINAAARVGGILANRDYPYHFIMENLQIQNNLIDSALKFNLQQFIFLGSSCIYPRTSPQPIKEEYLLTSPLESTNESYAIAKIAGIKTCEAARKQYGKNFISLMPCNLYGPHDNFSLKTSHVLPAMICKFHQAKQHRETVTLWGTGSPLREFLWVDDLASAVLFALENDLPDHLYNVGTGKEISIRQLAELVQEIVGHKGNIAWDPSKPDGTPRKRLDVSKLEKLGWKHQKGLREGIEMAYLWYLKNIEQVRKKELNET